MLTSIPSPAGALARAHDPSYPWGIARLLADEGLLGIVMQPEDGGRGGSSIDAVIAIQVLSEVYPKSDDVVIDRTKVF